MTQASNALAQAKMNMEAAINNTHWTNAEMDIVAYVFVDEPNAVLEIGGFRKQIDQILLLLPGRSAMAVSHRIRVTGKEIARRAKDMQRADGQARFLKAVQDHQAHVDKIRPLVLDDADGFKRLDQLSHGNRRNNDADVDSDPGDFVQTSRGSTTQKPAKGAGNSSKQAGATAKVKATTKRDGPDARPRRWRRPTGSFDSDASEELQWSESERSEEGDWSKGESEAWIDSDDEERDSRQRIAEKRPRKPNQTSLSSRMDDRPV